MSTTFAALGVPDALLRALAANGIETPFPIQAATIPDALAGRDLSGKAPTGSGKTIAFGVPLIAGVTRSAPKRPKGLVLVPTRELANQVADELRMLSGDLRILAVYGGARLEGQIKALRRGVDIVVACPGRLGDLIERRVCELRDVQFAVVDEADRMADMGFLPDVKRLLDQTRDDRQTLLFSATLDGAIDELVKRYQRNPVVHELPDEETGQVEHHFWKSERTAKVAITAQIVQEAGRCIVFCRTRHGADRVAKQLGTRGVTAAAIHGDRSQAQRERALDAFHRGAVDTLVATDVAARGIHVTGVQCVVHFDLPADEKDYVHRSGRTGRAGAVGLVVALVDGSQHRDAAKIRRGAGIQAELVDPAPAGLLAGAAARRTAAGVEPAPPATGSEGRRSSAPTVSDLAPGARRPERSAGRDRASSSGRSRRPEAGARRATAAPSADDGRRRNGAGWGNRPGEGRGRNVPGPSDRPGTGRGRNGTGSDIGPSDDGGRNGAQRDGRAVDVRGRNGAGHDGRPDDGRRGNRPAPRGVAGNRAAGNDVGRSGGGSSSRAERAGRTAPPDAPLVLDGGRAADASPTGAGTRRDKVRPSGSARRKAKRDALVAAGITPERTKRKRSGAPRPAGVRRAR